jgi:rod shape-determining protein MreB
MLDFLISRFRCDMGIDLGTANTLVFLKGEGIIIREPSVVAIDRETGRVLAVGEHAKDMIGRTPSRIQATRPLRDGVIADFDVTEKMLDYFINKARPKFSWLPPRVVVGIPSGITQVEKMAVFDAAKKAGAGDVYLIEEPMAAAIGAGLPVSEPYGSVIVDIGGGTTEVAVISLGGIVNCRSIRVAGDGLDEAIVAYARNKFNLLIGVRTAEEVKKQIGSAFPSPSGEEKTADIKGRDMVTGLPKVVTIASPQIREALAPTVNQIVASVKDTLEETSPELAADIYERGIVLAGGGALLHYLDKKIAQVTGIATFVAEDPLTCVVRGTEKVLENLSELKEVLTMGGRR